MQEYVKTTKPKVNNALPFSKYKEVIKSEMVYFKIHLLIKTVNNIIDLGHI